MTTPTPGSDSVAMDAPDEEGLTYVGRARAALAKVIEGVPIAVDFGGLDEVEAIDALTILVLVKGDRATAADVHDLVSVMRYADDEPDDEIVPFDALPEKQRGGYEVLTNAVQRAGRFVGRDGS